MSLFTLLKQQEALCSFLDHNIKGSDGERRRLVDMTTVATKVADRRGILGPMALICCIIYLAAGANSPMGR